MYSGHGARTDVAQLFARRRDNQADKIVNINLEQISEVVPGVVTLRELAIGLVTCHVVCELVGW